MGRYSYHKYLEKVVTVGILSGISYGLLLFATKIKRASRKRKLNKQLK